MYTKQAENIQRRFIFNYYLKINFIQYNTQKYYHKLVLSTCINI